MNESIDYRPDGVGFMSSWAKELPFINDSNGFLNESSPIEQTQFKPFYGEKWETYRQFYASIHGYISLSVCIFGLTANILIVIVLTRKNMVSPTNAILTGLAVADMMVMLSYIPFSIHNYIRVALTDEEKFSFGWAVFTLFHAHFTVVNHTISIWLTVTVAIWRFMAVCYPAATMRWRSLIRARIAILSTYVACTIFCIPVYITFTVSASKENQYTLYKVDFSDVAKQNNGLLRDINFWLFSVITKLVPCVALTGLSLGLIKVLYEANLRRKRLKVKSECDKSHDRTTKMLLAVLALFLLTEFPSGMLALLSGALGDEFFVYVYMNFGETMDILALVNSAVNFIIYCSMSRQFRDTFAFLFLTRWSARKWAAIPPTEPTQTLGTACV